MFYKSSGGCDTRSGLSGGWGGGGGEGGGGGGGGGDFQLMRGAMLPTAFFEKEQKFFSVFRSESIGVSWTPSRSKKRFHICPL
jgi:hypothetical protein